jgi:hypothetical protein
VTSVSISIPARLLLLDVEGDYTRGILDSQAKTMIDYFIEGLPASRIAEIHSLDGRRIAIVCRFTQSGKVCVITVYEDKK